MTNISMKAAYGGAAASMIIKGVAAA